MKKLVIAGVSILAVVLLFLSSQTSVVGYRVVKDSQEKLLQQTVNKVKTNLLTLKSLIPTGRQSTGLLANFYFLMFRIHLIIYSIAITLFVAFSGLSSWFPGMLIGLLIASIVTLPFAMLLMIPYAAIWPLTDLFYLFVFWLLIHGPGPQSLQTFLKNTERSSQ